MIADWPDVITVTDLPDGTRYTLPRRPAGAIRRTGFIPILMGVFIASWPIFGILFFLFVGPFPQGEALWLSIFAPLGCFGPICFPLAGFLVFIGLLTLAGHNEIVVRGGRLHAIDRISFLRMTRRRPIEEITGLRVELGNPGTAAARGGPMALGWYASLKADLRSGKAFTVCWGYPREWLLSLGNSLAGHCEGAVRPDAPFAVTPVAVSETALDPATIVDRPEQPTDSPAVLEERADGFVITVPPLGLRRGGGGFLFIWTLGWNALVLAISSSFVPAAFRGEVKWEGTDEPVSLAVCLGFMTPFWLVGIGSLIVLLHMGRRRATITATSGQLLIEEVGLFGTRQRQWQRDELADVRVVSKFTPGSEGGGTWKTDLCVQPHTGTPVHLLGYRPKPELEWIATTLRRALRLPAAEMAGSAAQV